MSALLRRIAAEGGHGMILHRGDPDAGAVMVATLCRGDATGLFERTLGATGYAVAPVGPADAADQPDYLARRRRADPDLWVVELEGNGGLPERLAREVLG